MEKNEPSSPPEEKKPSPQQTNTIPSVKSLFTESYRVFRSVIVPFVIFNILVFVATAVSVVLIGLGFILLGIGAGVTGIFTENLPVLGFGAITGFLIFFAAIAVISSIGQIGSIIILFDANPKIGVFSVIERSLKYVIPVILAGIVTSFLIFGGFFLFIIPGIIFSLFFTLFYYSIISENTGPLQGIRRSVFLVKSNFAAFFVRLLALWGALIIAIILLGVIRSAFPEGTGISGIFTLINIVIQMLISWYALSYMLTLFKHLQKVSPKGESSLKWITLIAVIGWVVAIVIGYFAINAISNFVSEQQNNSDLPQNLTPEEREEIEKIFEEIEQDEEFNIEDIDEYIEESTASPEMETETSTPPAQTF